MQNKSYARRDKLIAMEPRAKAIWKRNAYFKAQPNQKPKYYITFPSPYINGNLDLNHAFSLTKCDFHAWYKRLCGYNVLFPVSFHCTGMRIIISADRLAIQFKDKNDNNKEFPQHTHRQYFQLKKEKIDEKQIHKFVDPEYWLLFFPNLNQNHLIKFGFHIDYDRVFFTTDVNPYYNSFIEWQFNILKERGYLRFGRRPSIFSPLDKKNCSDHDRAQGEGAIPKEYTLVKIKILQLNQKLEKSLAGKKIYLVTVTNRPEIIYGLNCCFIFPNDQYYAIQMKDNEVFICSPYSAKNMAYQGYTRHPQKVQIIEKFVGSQLLGLPVSPPLSVYKKVFTLPILINKKYRGTGIIACVPNDSPESYILMKLLKDKEPIRQKFGITQQMISLDPIEIINVSNFGNQTAITICQQKKIRAPYNLSRLVEAQEQCQRSQKDKGTMIIGEYKGQSVGEARGLINKYLIDNNLGIQYFEPDCNVISRSGDECVVRFCEQWYLKYSDLSWKNKVLNYLKTGLKCSSQYLRNALIDAVNWLQDWGCSRQFGLGTKLPFDSRFLIDPLSDSTITMAYQTISYYLQGNLDGSEPGILGIKPNQINSEFWDYIFLGKQYKCQKIPCYKLDILRKSFQYWYPVDIRCSAKSLIRNHLIMCLFNHIAIWQDQPSKWPQALFCNGMIIYEGRMMSQNKSLITTLQQCLQDYGTDPARLIFAQSGDTIDDSNFWKQTGTSSILALSTLQMYLNIVFDQHHTYRKQSNKNVLQFDIIFQNQMEAQISKVKQAYEDMRYRDVVKYGLYEFEGLKNMYIRYCSSMNPRIDLIERYIQLQLLFLYPICPHFCQVAYIDYFLSIVRKPHDFPELIGYCSFPAPLQDINHSVIRGHDYIIKLQQNMRYLYRKTTKTKKKQSAIIKKATIIYLLNYQDYQLYILKLLQSCLNQKGQIRTDWRKQVKLDNKKQRVKAFKFGNQIFEDYNKYGKKALDDTLMFDQRKNLLIFLAIIKEELKLDIEIKQMKEAIGLYPNQQQACEIMAPGRPAIFFD